jgi:hypothetical protein
LITGEKWWEVLNLQEDYWERKSEKYTNHCGNQANIIDLVVLRSGVNEYRNNRNFYDVEEWREYSDGRLIKKKFNDNGYGRRILAETGKKLHKEKFKSLRRVNIKQSDGDIEEALFDEDGVRLRNLQEYLD